MHDHSEAAQLRHAGSRPRRSRPRASPLTRPSDHASARDRARSGRSHHVSSCDSTSERGRTARVERRDQVVDRAIPGVVLPVEVAVSSRRTCSALLRGRRPACVQTTALVMSTSRATSSRRQEPATREPSSSQGHAREPGPPESRIVGGSAASRRSACRDRLPKRSAIHVHRVPRVSSPAESNTLLLVPSSAAAPAAAARHSPICRPIRADRQRLRAEEPVERHVVSRNRARSERAILHTPQHVHGRRERATSGPVRGGAIAATRRPCPHAAVLHTASPRCRPTRAARASSRQATSRHRCATHRAARETVDLLREEKAPPNARRRPGHR